TASTSTEIRHAMLVVNGPPLTTKELEERWARFTKSNFFPPPLSRGSFRRDPQRNCVEGFDLRLMSWGDGSGVPTSGKRLAIVGLDDDGLLHFRVFDAVGIYRDTDETKLPGAQARAISTLKKRLPRLSAKKKLTIEEKAQVIREVPSIVGQTYVETCLFGEV